MQLTIIDGIESAESRKDEIFKRLINYGITSNQTEQFRPIISSLRACQKKDAGNDEIIKSVIECLSNTTDTNERINLALIALSLNKIDIRNYSNYARDLMQGTGRERALFSLFFDDTMNPEMLNPIKINIELFYLVQDLFELESPSSNAISAIGQAITFSMGKTVIAKRAFDQQLVALLAGFSGPFADFMLNTLEIAYNSNSSICLFTNLEESIFKTGTPIELRKFHSIINNEIKSSVEGFVKIKLSKQAKGSTPILQILERIGSRRGIRLSRPYRHAFLLGKNDEYWQKILGTPNASDSILDLLITAFEMEPKEYWREALRSNYIATIPRRIILFEESVWREVEIAFREERAGEFEKYFAAWQLILDAWMKAYLKDEIVNRSIFDQIVKLTRDIDEPCLSIAHCIRDYIYGNKGRLNEFLEMLKSKDVKYASIFRDLHLME